MVKILCASAGVLLAFSSVPAFAKEHYYFNKNGVSREEFAQDRKTCLELAGAVDVKSPGVYVANNSNLTTTQNAAVAGIAGLFAGMMERARERRVGRSVERTCMADKGYVRFVVEKDVIAAISKLKSDTDRLDRLFEMAAAAQPVGTKGNE